MMDVAGHGVGTLSRREHGSGRRASNISQDIWAAVRSGTVRDVCGSLASMKKVSASINNRNPLGVTPLHLSVWRNHIPIIQRLLAAGADPDARDGESGWTSLHRALHFGHLAAAAVLIEAGASLAIEDSKGRTPIDLVSGSLADMVGDTAVTEVYTWGNGANYQLGTGTAGIQRAPARVDSLQGLDVRAVAAARFHSGAVSNAGDIFTWGFGRGGRLGHADFDVHSGQVAVIKPRQLAALGVGAQRRVRSIAAAKHHTVIATHAGDVFTWGSNREGRLGYNSVDTQPTPRRVAALRVRVVAVAAANKHSACVTEAGEAFTWGGNLEGQLGYGTSHSQSNYVPRVVDSLKGTPLVAVAAAKCHTLALSANGEVFSWGYRMVMPRRVAVARDKRKAGAAPLKFHRKEKLRIVALAAGLRHSTLLSADGLAFCWASHDPSLRCRQLAELSGHRAVAVAAGKYRTAIVTAAGDVFAWDGDVAHSDAPPRPARVAGLKRAALIAVGEMHSVALLHLHVPPYPANQPLPPAAARAEAEDRDEEDQGLQHAGGVGYDLAGSSHELAGGGGEGEGVASLKELCQGVLARQVADPRNALQLMEVAESLGAHLLQAFCEVLAMRNLDYILTTAPHQLAHCRPALLAAFERKLAQCSGQPWSRQRLPTPSSSHLPAVVSSGNRGACRDDEGDEEEGEGATWQDSLSTGATFGSDGLSGGHAGSSAAAAAAAAATSPLGAVDMGEGAGGAGGSFTQGQAGQQQGQGQAGEEEAVARQLRSVRKKLQQIADLEDKRAAGAPLDAQQLAKVRTRRALQACLAHLEAGVLPPPLPAMLPAAAAAALCKDPAYLGSGGGEGGFPLLPGGEAGGNAGGGPPHERGKKKKKQQQQQVPPPATPGNGGRGGAGAGGAAAAVAAEAAGAAAAAARRREHSAPEEDEEVEDKFAHLLARVELTPGGAALPPMCRTEGWLSPSVPAPPSQDSLHEAGTLSFSSSSSIPAPPAPRSPLGAAGLGPAAAAAATSTSTLKSSGGGSGGKRKGKKGGLSMFLSGALESPEPPLRPHASSSSSLSGASAGAPAKPEGPAWGGATVRPRAAAPAASLRDIQTQQNAEGSTRSLASVLLLPAGSPAAVAAGGSPMQPRPAAPSAQATACPPGDATVVGGRNPKSIASGFRVPAASSPTAAPGGSGERVPGGGGRAGPTPGLAEAAIDSGGEGGVARMRIPLSQLVKSSAPVAVRGARGRGGLSGPGPADRCKAESPPVWAAAKSSSSPSQSLRYIQQQQEERNAHLRQAQALVLSTSPGPGMALPSAAPDAGSGGMASAASTNKWYRPEADAGPASLRCIQIEEEAMKQLRRAYGGSVRVVTREVQP